MGGARGLQHNAFRGAGVGVAGSAGDRNSPARNALRVKMNSKNDKRSTQLHDNFRVVISIQQVQFDQRVNSEVVTLPPLGVLS